MDILTGILFNSAISDQEVEAVLREIASIALRASLSVDRRTHVYVPNCVIVGPWTNP